MSYKYILLFMFTLSCKERVSSSFLKDQDEGQIKITIVKCPDDIDRDAFADELGNYFIEQQGLLWKRFFTKEFPKVTSSLHMTVEYDRIREEIATFGTKSGYFRADAFEDKEHEIFIQAQTKDLLLGALRHELMHYLIYLGLGSTQIRWMDEGLATTLEHSFVISLNETMFDLLVQNKKKEIPFKDLLFTFRWGKEEDNRMRYIQSMLMVRYLTQLGNRGEKRFIHFFEHLTDVTGDRFGKFHSNPTEEQYNAALQKFYDIKNIAEFEEKFWRWIMTSPRFKGKIRRFDLETIREP